MIYSSCFSDCLFGFSFVWIGFLGFLGLIWGFHLFGGCLLFLLLFSSVDLFQSNLGEVALI